MNGDHSLPARRSTRLDGYDYTKAGGYFVTVVTDGRVERFGAMINGEMQLSRLGQMIFREWQNLPSRFPGVLLDAFIVMPNHIHGVLIIEGKPHHTKANHPVGAQRPIQEPRLSTSTLRPGTEPPFPRLDSDDNPRAQRDGSSDWIATGPLRPYGPFEPFISDKQDGSDGRPHVDPGSLGAIIRAFKSSTTLRYHRMRDGGTGPLWQRNYYEHILRGTEDLEHIRAYILFNAATWDTDQANLNGKVNR